jgi:hypothetical protein
MSRVFALGRPLRSALSRRSRSVLCAFVLAGAASLATIAAPTAGARNATPLWGVTVDRISHLQDLTNSLAALPAPPTTRVYFDVHEPAAYYAQAVTAIAGVSAVMGELLDSSDEKHISVAAFQARTEAYVHTLAGQVSIWEIGNEVNGNWTGRYADVAAKLAEAYDDVSAAGGRTALTLYANDFGPDNCGDGPAELTPTQFTQQYVPARVASGLSYVLLSYYPTQCGGREPTSAELASYLRQLHALYPNAAIGFGEVGLPRRATRTSQASAEQIMSWAYSLAPSLPYYVGGYFWWYGAEDALRPQARLREALASAFDDELTALDPAATRVGLTPQLAQPHWLDHRNEQRRRSALSDDSPLTRVRNPADATLGPR